MKITLVLLFAAVSFQAHAANAAPSAAESVIAGFLNSSSIYGGCKASNCAKIAGYSCAPTVAGSGMTELKTTLFKADRANACAAFVGQYAGRADANIGVAVTHPGLLDVASGKFSFDSLHDEDFAKFEKGQTLYCRAAEGVGTARVPFVLQCVDKNGNVQTFMVDSATFNVNGGKAVPARCSTIQSDGVSPADGKRFEKLFKSATDNSTGVYCS